MQSYGTSSTEELVPLLQLPDAPRRCNYPNTKVSGPKYHSDYKYNDTEVFGAKYSSHIN